MGFLHLAIRLAVMYSALHAQLRPMLEFFTLCGLSARKGENGSNASEGPTLPTAWRRHTHFFPFQNRFWGSPKTGSDPSEDQAAPSVSPSSVRPQVGQSGHDRGLNTRIRRRHTSVCETHPVLWCGWMGVRCAPKSPRLSLKQVAQCSTVDVNGKTISSCSAAVLVVSGAWDPAHSSSGSSIEVRSTTTCGWNHPTMKNELRENETVFLEPRGPTSPRSARKPLTTSSGDWSW